MQTTDFIFILFFFKYSSFFQPGLIEKKKLPTFLLNSKDIPIQYIQFTAISSWNEHWRKWNQMKCWYCDVHLLCRKLNSFITFYFKTASICAKSHVIFHKNVEVYYMRHHYRKADFHSHSKCICPTINPTRLNKTTGLNCLFLDQVWLNFLWITLYIESMKKTYK